MHCVAVGQQSAPPDAPTQACVFGQQTPPMQTAPVGQQIAWPSFPTAQTGRLSEHTHRPSRQMLPGGQQNRPPLGFRHARGSGQQLLPMQTVPSGQQNVPQSGRLSGQMHRPSLQTVPSGQQMVTLFGVTQICSRLQQVPATQKVPSGQQVPSVVPGMRQNTPFSGQTHRPSTQSVSGGQQTSRHTGRLSGQRQRPSTQIVARGQQNSGPPSGGLHAA